MKDRIHKAYQRIIKKYGRALAKLARELPDPGLSSKPPKKK
jgi:hypothetical protein